jgi:hypothetical protein
VLQEPSNNCTAVEFSYPELYSQVAPVGETVHTYVNWWPRYCGSAVGQDMVTMNTNVNDNYDLLALETASILRPGSESAHHVRESHQEN